MHLNTTVLSPDFFLLDLQDFFSDLESGGGGGGGGGYKIRALKMTS